MSFAAALQASPELVSTRPVGAGYVYHLIPPGLGDVLGLPFGQALVAELRERGQLAAQLGHLDAGAQAQARAAWEADRNRGATVEQRLVRALDDLPHLQRLAVRLVRGVTYPDLTSDGAERPTREAQLCLTLDGEDGWAAPANVERMAVTLLTYDHLSVIAGAATLGAMGALRRAVWLPRRSAEPDGGASAGP